MLIYKIAGKVFGVVGVLFFLSVPIYSATPPNGKELEKLLPVLTKKYSDSSSLLKHPLIKLLDEDGRPVIYTNNPVSTRRTCGACHDYDYIVKSYHFQQGADEYEGNYGEKHNEPGSYSPGMYGRQYDYPYYHMTPLDWKKRGVPFEYGTPNWALQCAICHTGGGPLEHDRRGRRFDKVPDSSIEYMDPDYYFWDRKGNQFLKWDWKKSGVREANCLICHTPNYSKGIQDQRTVGVGMFKKPHFSSSTSAGLLTTGIVEKVTDAGKVFYNKNAFKPDGTLKEGYLKLSGEFARTDACLQCHAAPVREGHVDPWYNYPVVRTINRGILRKAFVWSGENISDSKDNIVGKDTLKRPWDVHAKAGLSCIDCHVVSNRPGEIHKEVRDTLWQRASFAEYLKRPDHNFGKGHPITWQVRKDRDYTVKRCEDCHDAEKRGHDWLPEKELHLKTIACETCHIPKTNYWAINSFNFVFPRPEPFSKGVKITGACGEAPQRFLIHGAKGNPIEDPNAEITGFYPLYIPRKLTPNGEKKIMPYEVTFSIHWIDRSTGERLYFSQILNAFFDRVDNKWVPKKKVLETFDENKDGKIDDMEALCDTKEKVECGKECLRAIGIKDPDIELVAMPFSLSHGVAPKEYAIRDCNQCHTENSRIFNKGEYSRMIFPRKVLFGNSRIYSEDFDSIPIAVVRNGAVYWDNSQLLKDYHLVGAIETEETSTTKYPIIEILGILIFLLTVLGILLHMTLRIVLAWFKKS